MTFCNNVQMCRSKSKHQIFSSIIIWSNVVSSYLAPPNIKTWLSWNGTIAWNFLAMGKSKFKKQWISSIRNYLRTIYWIRIGIYRQPSTRFNIENRNLNHECLTIEKIKIQIFTRSKPKGTPRKLLPPKRYIRLLCKYISCRYLNEKCERWKYGFFKTAPSTIAWTFWFNECKSDLFRSHRRQINIKYICIVRITISSA